jgi:F-type H+-transporting ATPase subunit a
MNFLYSEICSPLDQFEIRNLVSLNGPVIGNVQVSVTNIGLYLTIATIIIVSLNLLSTNYNKIVSNE